MSDHLSVDVYDMNGKKVESLSVDPKALGGIVRKRLIHEVSLIQERNLRQGSAHTKTRGEIRASSQKPWRQKGTGRARAGNRNSNIWKGGSVAHGPRPRDFHTQLPKKTKRQALASVILGKILDKQLILIDSFKFDQPKTKNAVTLLDKLNINKTALIANHELNDNFVLSFKNINHVNTINAEDLNVLSVLKHQNLLMTKKGFEDLLERVQGKKAEAVGA